MRKTLLIFLIVYGLAYIYVRQTTMETWDADRRDYVIYPEDAIGLYYLFRPVSYLDGILTGVGTHLGPHQ